MLRASSYNIYVDLPDEKGKMLLVHGYRGTYDAVSQRVATYIRSLERVRPPKPLFGEWSTETPVNGEVISPSDKTIETLKERGYLTELSVEEEESLFTKFATALHKQAKRMPGYLFMPTYDCNLRCPYCFQDHMRTNPKFAHLLRMMRRDVVDRFFKAMPTLEAFHGVPVEAPRQRSIGFFGGEPLLEQNRPLVEYIINKALSLSEAKFAAVTNGTDLHSYRDLLGQERLSVLQITLDGPPREHDKRRIYEDGSGSFERIARNITMALDLGVHIDVRANIDHHNIHDLPELADEIIKQGWDAYNNFRAYTAVIHANNGITDPKTTFTSWELDKALTRMREEYPGLTVIDRPDDTLKRQAHQILSNSNAVSDPFAFMRSTFCSAHDGMYLFDAFGDMYACWERTGDPKIRIGCVDKEGNVVFNEKMLTMWRSRNVTTNDICRKCRYALSCGGGCAVLAVAQRGEFFTNFCDGYAARFRAAVAEAYQDHVAGIIPLSKVTVDLERF
jgi:uncharacterized protein